MNTLTQRNMSLKRFSFGDKENLVIRLVLINLILFAGVLLVKIIFAMTDAGEYIPHSQKLSWAVLAAEPQQFITHPWTVLTYMFIHTDFWVLFSCMIWFWGYGTLIQGMYGTYPMLPLYILGGVAGAVTFFVAYQIIPGLAGGKADASTIGIGASASVIAVIACTTVLIPKFRILPMLGGGVPLYFLSIFYLVFCFIGREGDVLYGYLAANTGGLLLGAYFGYRIKVGDRPGDFVNRFIYQFAHFFEPDKEALKEEKEIRTAVRLKPQKMMESIQEESVDDLLDKINKKGYDALTKEEKDILIKASRES